MNIHFPIHPFTGLAAIGYRRNGAPIWPVRGGSEDEGTGSTDNGTTDETPSEKDWRSEFEGQRKVNRDLERKGRNDQKVIADLQSQLAKLSEGSAPKDEVEAKLEQARKEAATEAIQVANRRVVRAEIKAAAAGAFADPADAVAFLNLDDFDVDDEGEVDSAAIKSALDDLLKRKPHLAAQGRRWAGNGDGGPRDSSTPVLPGQHRVAHAYATSSSTRKHT